MRALSRGSLRPPRTARYIRGHPLETYKTLSQMAGQVARIIGSTSYRARLALKQAKPDCFFAEGAALPRARRTAVPRRIRLGLRASDCMSGKGTLSGRSVAADRNIRIPASVGRSERRPYDVGRARLSATQWPANFGSQPEEHNLPVIPRQQSMHDLAPRPCNLAWNPNEGV